ncbi:MAG: DNA polymerase III subunit alpha, partial [Gemmatimonadota bacterium]|nr:DNA polymerase III subunit alpha [Gemmatimonadota bacterium]
AVSHGVNPHAAAEIWRQIRSFAGYAFCKAHSASFARVSFQVAYLKAHYPAEFMAAVLSNGGGFYGPSAYIEEARRMGLRILGPDINRSDICYKGSGRALRVGLGVVARVGRKSLEALLEARRAGGFFTSLADFSSRAQLPVTEMRALIRCGAFDCFELTRPELLWRLEILCFHRSGRRKSPEHNSSPAAASLDSPMFPSLELSPGRQIVPRLPEYPRLTRLRLEQELLGFTVSEHPLNLYEQALAGKDLISSREIPSHEGQRVRLAGRPIAGKRIETSGKGAMMFLSMDDPAGTFEVVMFPDCYRRCAARALGPGPFLVTGRVAGEYGAWNIVCEKLDELGTSAAETACGRKERTA